MTNAEKGHEIFFVGSVALPSAQAVFETIGRAFGPRIRRIPDGETGDRLGWLEWQNASFAANPAFEQVSSEGDWRNPTAPAKWQHRIWHQPKPGIDPKAITFGALGYARTAIESYAEFRALKASGVVATTTRFMVAIPSPFNLINQLVAPAARAAVEPAYERRLLAEVDEIAAAIPHGELALQWDVAQDMQAYDGARKTWFEPARKGIQERLIRIGNHAPTTIELGYHLCYGSFGGRHFVEPKDMGDMVELWNAISGGVRRRIDFVHMPVPIDRSDDAYFAPLGALKLRAETRLYLGLIHDGDGVAGAERRIAAARRYVRDFGIATECGFGRLPPETTPALIALHAKLGGGGP